MTRWLLGSYALASLVIVSVSCAAPPSRAVTSGTTVPSGAGGMALLPNLLVQLIGPVQLRRTGWKDFQPVGFGAVVESGDLIRVSFGGVASVFCGDEMLWDASPKALPADGSESSIPCTAGRPPRPLDMAGVRGTGPASVIEVISPRNTALLTNTPSLRWRGVQGVDTYTVKVLNDDGDTQIRSPVQANANQMDWPREWPPLKDGHSYVLEVNGGSHMTNSSFRLLPRSQAHDVATQEKKLRARPLDDSAADLLVAELYRFYDLRADAAKLLQRVVTTTPSSTVWLMLGQTQLQMGDSVAAHESFTQALRLAQAVGERVVEGSAHLGIGQAQLQMGYSVAAHESFTQALRLAQAVGERVVEMSAHLSLGLMLRCQDPSRLEHLSAGTHCSKRLAMNRAS